MHFYDVWRHNLKTVYIFIENLSDTTGALKFSINNNIREKEHFKFLHSFININKDECKIPTN